MTKSPLLLLAEDDKSLSTVTARALRQAGFSVQATDTLSTLWQWLEAGQETCCSAMSRYPMAMLSMSCRVSNASGPICRWWS